MSFERILLSTALLGCGLMLGCPASNEYNAVPDTGVANVDEHAHHHDAGPHGGHILELGEYHGELAMGEDRIVSLYVLGEDAKSAVPVTGGTVTLHLEVGDNHVDVTLAPAPLEGEAEGASSRFSSTADAIPESIKDIEGIHGKVELKVGEKVSSAAISHDHGHGHGHDHGHDH